MDTLKSKERAVSLLLVFGSILLLMAVWDFPEGFSDSLLNKPIRPPQAAGQR